MVGLLAPLLVIFFSALLREVQCHGRLRHPPSRSTLWRYGFPGRANYNDHELNCGGFSTHWGRNGGRCGVCGDNFADKRPRANEGGGLYGQGVIVGRFSQGGIIEAKVEVTANHKGFFEFSLCPHNRPFEPASDDCFRVLELADGAGTRWQLYDDVTPKTYTIAVRLPSDVTCSQCVFRWYWKSGNNWGTEDGHSGLGYGPQETFIACSDIAIGDGETKVISSSAGGNEHVPRTGRRPLIGRRQPITTTYRPTTTTQYRQRIPDDDHDDDDDDAFDDSDSDESEVAFDPSRSETEVTPSCRAVGRWRLVPGMGPWCVRNCEMGYCPSTHCCCGC